MNKTFSFIKRAEDKQGARDADKTRLEAGDVTVEELRKQNSFVKSDGFRAKKIGFSPKYRPENGDRFHISNPNVDEE